jgi:hypothetical protein
MSFLLCLKSVIILVVPSSFISQLARFSLHKDDELLSIKAVDKAIAPLH